MNREPTGRRQNGFGSPVPGAVPPICEGGSLGSPLGSPQAALWSPVPPHRGDGEREPGTTPRWFPKPGPNHRLGKHRCGAIVLAALDHWACALQVICDPYPLSPLGEVHALRDGRRTYQVRPWGVLVRTAHRIAGNPPGDTRTVLAAHVCEREVPHAWRQPPKPRPIPTNTREVPF